MSDPIKQMGELLPCPFCGGHAKTHTRTDQHGTWLSVFCDREGCANPETHAMLDGKAIDQWNRRSRSAERREWLSIESAPKDGTKILGWIDDGSLCRTVRWVEASEPAPDDYGHDAGWASAEGATYPAVGEAGAPGSDQPIYWQPLPSPPSKTE